MPALPFSGAEILARGVATGHQVGATLKALQALWIRAGFPQEPEKLAALLDEALARARGERR
jgi:poly(A) polymerase